MNSPDIYRAGAMMVTGGAGFIGSNFVRTVLGRGLHGERLIVYDKLTYAGNLENLAGCGDGMIFVHGDICDARLVSATLAEHHIDTVVHFAAESHVDRSILGPLTFTQTNVIGTHTMVECARAAGVRRFVHISTDEVYGSLGAAGRFTESTPLDPTSPYAASKAASDLIVLASARTFGFPALVTRCSNNYGPYQFPEKLIPLMIMSAMEDGVLPVYGGGKNVRDWIHTSDHTEAVLAVLERGRVGEVYNIGAENEQANIDIVHRILGVLEKPDSLIRYVSDRPAHDRRYAIDAAKIRRELGWCAAMPFEEGLRATIEWYRTHPDWLARIRTGEYLSYYDEQYNRRINQSPEGVRP